MIKLVSVEIEGFITPSQHVKLEFADSNVICIYGDNGSGKTIFLEILYAVFARDEKKLKNYSVEKVAIKYIQENLEIKQQIKELKEKLEKSTDEDEKEHLKSEIRELNKQISDIKSFPIETHRDEEYEIYYDFSELDNSELYNSSYLFLGIERGIHKKETYFPRRMLWSFFNMYRELENGYRISNKDIDNFTDRLVDYLKSENKDDRKKDYFLIEEKDRAPNLYFPYIEIDTIEELLLYKYEMTIKVTKEKITKALVKTFEQNIKKDIELKTLDIDKLLDNKNLIIEASSDFSNSFIEKIELLEKDRGYITELKRESLIYSMLVNITDSLGDEFKIFNRIKIFIESFNNFLSCNKKIVFSSDKINIETPNGMHSLKKLSSGERHMLTFLATILLLGDIKDFILIDEPEISLNVNWQTNILSIISELAPNSQIIVATHSPLVVENYPKSLVEIKLC
jgi:predicted ATPase